MSTENDNVIPFPGTDEPEGPETLIAPTIMHLTGITYRQLDYWTRTGLLTPLGNATPGAGHAREYPLDQLDRAKAISALLRAGLDLPAVRKHIDTFLTVGALTYGPVTITYTPEKTDGQPDS